MTGEFAIAVHALVFLNHKGTMVNSEELAENVCTNPARVRKVMGFLKKAGIVDTKEGVEGGYYMKKKAPDVSLNEIGDALGAAYVSSSWKSGNRHMACMIASGMADIMDEIYEDMNQICRRYLNSLTIESIDQKIFKKN